MSTLTRRTPLKSKTPLKAHNSLSKSYRQKVKSGVKKPYRYHPVPKQTYHSVIHDLKSCHITGERKNIHVHHIFGASNKGNSERYGFLVALRSDYHNMSDHGIHFDKALDLKYKRMCEDYWLKHYGTQEEFIEVFGKWW